MPDKNIKAPIMQRSRTQIMSSYAPGSYFTFEGGLAACKSVAISVRPIHLPTHTVRLVRDRIEELVRSWYERAITARGDNDNLRILPEMCVDRRLLAQNGVGIRGDIGSLFELVVPSRVGYVPEPITLICSNCNRIHWFENSYRLYQDLDRIQNEVCPANEHNSTCDWHQLDVMFVHWSGGVQSAKPERNQWYADSGVTHTFWRCTCGSRDVALDRSSSQIGSWSFRCASPSCGLPQPDRWVQLDRNTLLMLRENFFTEGRRVDTAMEATSYRASVVHYVQADRVIAFKDGSLLEKLNPMRVEELKTFVAQRFGFDTTDMDENSIRQTIDKYPEESDRVDTYLKRLEMVKEMEDQGFTDVAQQLRQSAQEIRDDWQHKGFLTATADLPAALENALTTRRYLTSKYDAFRLLVEHESLENECLRMGPGPTGKRPFVPFENPDDDLIHPELSEGIRDYKTRLGMSRIGLIRNFELCFFSYGYTRMSATPTLPDKHNTTMPVRLNLFRPINVSERQANPIYTVKQENEAIYVQLEEEVVRHWLRELNCVEGEALEDGPIGSTILENIFPMSAHLDNLPTQNEKERPKAYLATYTLLHTYAHHLIHAITEFAGLDAGSLGEYIFPGDLAFVVYRSGMTMDLGNISAMWRNNGRAFLDHLLIPTSLNCGLGTLCTERGGACPNCVMVPEVTCIAQNRLLSRSVLNGDGHPEEDGVNERIAGYFEIAGIR